jgi:hypothetical protein
MDTLRAVVVANLDHYNLDERLEIKFWTVIDEEQSDVVWNGVYRMMNLIYLLLRAAGIVI